MGKGGGKKGGGKGKGKGKGGGFSFEPDPPDEVALAGTYCHEAEGQIVAQSTNTEKLPMFNIFAYTEQKKKIGKIDEILGQIRNVHFSIIPEQGIEPSSFKEGFQFYISTNKFTPLQKFLDLGKPRKGGKGKGKGGKGGKGGKKGGKGGKKGGKGGKKGGK
eukprot:TRINITY_DN3724_c1_g1_i1.p1 TRINITY_DN3724_c1_g1~~TRINITY_DN3724_c1_g1_i1.p1  ORF type:complete len:161 (+),score=49.51 TRINITY_DN3724_c1_g1_i1:119-601(+)